MSDAMDRTRRGSVKTTTNKSRDGEDSDSDFEFDLVRHMSIILFQQSLYSYSTRWINYVGASKLGRPTTLHTLCVTFNASRRRNTVIAILICNWWVVRPAQVPM